MENWSINTAATTTGAYYMPIVTTGSSAMTWVGGSGGGYWPAPAAPQGPLEWLDSEVEKTCALARQG